MSCDEIQELLSLYSDDGLTPGERARCDHHLEVCPVCRAHVADLRNLRMRLASLPRPAAPPDLVPAINHALVAEVSVERARRNAPASEAFVDFISVWLQPRLMRYAFSSVASLILFASVFLALRPHMIALHDAANTFAVLTAPSDGSPRGFNINEPISPSSYAALRTPYNTESPSLNPNGGIASLNLSNPHLHVKNGESDDMMVIADVFSNGTASLADVMHAPKDRQMLDDFQAALRNNAAFVPAALDRRPETMRVVFSIQRVEVRERNY
jgi:Putative zinc-finger